MELLLYFIMIPTSKYSLIAVNIITEMENKQQMKVKHLYLKFRRELCKSIVELCAINQGLMDSNLESSLEKVALVLGFSSPKDFVSRECHYLLPFLVPLVIKIPRVEVLIQEVASLVQLRESELLASKYGNIFLRIFLNEPDDVKKKSMNFLESVTGMSGAALRKRSFKVCIFTQ